MRKDIAVVVRETPVHKVEVRQGIMGERGPKGDKGDKGEKGNKGDKGDSGTKGDSAKELEIVITNESTIFIDSSNHGIQYITTNNSEEAVTVLLSECTTLNENNDLIDHKGVVVLFTQGTETTIVFTTVEGVSLKKPKDSLTQPYGIGSSVAVIAQDRFNWILVGDVATTEAYVNVGE